MNTMVSVFTILAAVIFYGIALRAASVLLPAMVATWGFTKMYGLSQALRRRLLAYNLLWFAAVAVVTLVALLVVLP